MKSNKVTVEISVEQEMELINKYGRKCSRETLVYRALDEVAPVQKIKRKPKASKAEVAQPGLLPGNGDSEVSNG